MTVEQVLLVAGGAATAGAGVWLLQPQSLDSENWVELRFGRELDAAGVDGVVRSLAADRRRSPLAFEVCSQAGSIGYRVGTTRGSGDAFVDRVHAFCPTVTTASTSRPLPSEGWAWSIRFDTRTRPLRADQAQTAAQAVTTALGRVATGETVVVQLLVGPRLPAMSVPNAIDTLPTGSWLERAGQLLAGADGPVDGERRRALRDKVTEPGFKATVRIGVTASTRQRARSLAQSVLAALRVIEGPGVRLRVSRDRYENVVRAREPWRWPLSVNVAETAALVAWPIGDGDYSGVDRSGARPTRTPRPVAMSGRIIGDSTFPGDIRPMALSPADSLLHLHTIGPTGVGKSTLLLNLITQDIAAGRAVVVIDPKGDLIDEVTARIPDKRLDDVVVLDPADASRPVGLNPLRPAGRMPELVADQVLAVFHGLYRDNWGPRTQDILHASLLTLIGRPDATLCALPVLLSDPGYRRKVISQITDEIALRPFWSWFESVSDAERQQAIAPVMNKLRAFLLRPRMRAVIGQATPSFDMSTVFTQRKVLLVSLAKGLLGPEASALLGSLVVSQLWNATLARVAISPERRHPVMCFIDEFQDYLHLPTDLADVLAQARGLGLGMTLAHQHLAQLTPQVRQAVMANARSRVVFQLGADDAVTFAKNAPGLDVEDFTSLGRYEIYASLAADGAVSAFGSGRTRAPSPPTSSAGHVRAASRNRYGRDVDDVERELADLLGQRTGKDAGEVGRRPRRRP